MCPTDTVRAATVLQFSPLSSFLIVFVKQISPLSGFVVSGVNPGVKNDADFKNYICKRTFQRLGMVSVGFNVNRVDLRKIFILSS